jgi:aminomethyltransferase
LVVNASNIEKDWNWCVANNTVGAELENASDWISQLAIQGPKAVELLQKLTSVDLSKISYYSFNVGDFAGVNEVILSNTGYTGAGGFELYFYNEDAAKIWTALFEIGAEYGIKPIGLGARDTLRLEKGFCLYGNDIDDTTSPLEAGLGWITKFVDGKDFIDREFLAKQKADGLSRKLIRFELTERGIPRHGYKIVNQENVIIGRVTSGTMLPDSKKGIGMGYVKPEYTKSGSKIFIQIRNKNLEAIVVK